MSAPRKRLLSLLGALARPSIAAKSAAPLIKPLARGACGSANKLRGFYKPATADMKLESLSNSP